MIVANVTRTLLGLLIVSSLWSLMHAFTGGSAGDLQTLDSLQFSGILFALLVIVSCAILMSRGRELSAGIRLAWMHIPTWLIFAGFVLISLAVIGELSYYLLRDATWIPNDWFNHSALLCLTLACVSFLFVSGTGHFLAGRKPYSRDRW